ncbi:putative nuclear pore complex protein [Apostichopus japonicus]|uniref:Nuclear pore complex protein Nup153 n=1 Tax=Stichopus japonicus TaxID=307972 RepID=A0A2G8K7L1_STIJA|nr:putative nuclear pore complex protein [Apostichopus japonicus]
MGIPQRKHTPLPFIAYTQPIQTSTPVDNDFIQQPLRNVQTEERDDETDSSVSTSGCSSLLPHVDRADHKEKIAKSNLEQLSEWGQSSTSTPSRMSLWSDTNTLASQSHRGSRQVESKPQPAAKRPRFNASYFGTPRQNTTLTQDDRHQSSFYIGRTTFGGMSSYRSPAARKKYNPSPYQVHLPVKRHIRPKPAAQTRTDPDFGVTSNTAMKILNTLDRMSTPLSDAKRIPLTPTPSPFAYKPRRVAASERHKPVGGPPVSGLQIGEKAKVIPNTQPPLPKYPASSSWVSESATVASTAPPLSTAQPSNSNTHWTPVASVAQASNFKPQKSTPVPPSSPPKSGGKMKSKSRNPLHYSASRANEDEVVSNDTPAFRQRSEMLASHKIHRLSPHIEHFLIKTMIQILRSLFVVKSPTNGGPKKPASSLPPAYGGQGGRSNFVEDTPAAPSKPNANPTSQVTPMMTSTPFSGNFTAPQFKFSTPQAKQEEEGSGINFTFSEPAVKGSSFGKDSLPTKAAEGEFTFSAPSQKVSLMGSGKDAAGLLFSKPVENEDQKVAEEEEDDSSGGIKVARSLKSGSCLQILGIGSSKPVTTSASPKKTQDTSSASSVFDKFKPAVGSWECDTCLVRNGKESLKCVACQADKPGAKTTSLAEKFKPAPGSWECGTCLIRNNAGVDKCIACSSSRPVSSENKTNDDTTLSLSEKFKPPIGSWECDTCLVRNKAEATNCVACSSERPGGVEKANSQQGSSNSKSLAEMFKPPAGSWSCETCLIQNQAKDTKCVACQSLKPGAKASQEQSQTKGFSIQGTEFKLATPLSFGSKLKDNESTAKASASVKPSLSEMFKPPEGSWECDTCLVRNKPASSRCVACETPKPGSEPALRAPPASSFKFGSSTSSESATSTQGFKIAGSIPSFLSSGTTLGNGGFKIDSGTTPTDNGNPSVGFKLPPGVNFGSIGGTSNQLSGATSSDAVSSSGGFSLGSVRDKDTFGGGLSFQPPKDLGDSSKVADSSAPLNIGFKFGESNEDGKNKKSTTFTFGASSTTDETDKLSGTGAATLAGGAGIVEKKDQTVVKTAADATNQSSGLGFQFGAKLSEPLQSSVKATPNVNPFQSNLTSTGSKPAFSFGAPVSSESKPSASVTNAVITNQSSSSSSLDTTNALPTFQFGSTQKSNQPLQQAVMFGKRKESEPSSTSVEKPAFNFAGSNPSGPPVKFGMPSASSELPKPGLTFGASKTPGTSNPQTNASLFQFGVQPKSDVPPAQTSSPFAFGAKPQQSQVPVSNASGFQFGMVSSSSQNSQKPEKKPFTFGAVTTSSQSAAGSFTASKNFSGFDSAGTGPTKSAVPSFGGTASGFGSSAAPLNNSPVQTCSGSAEFNARLRPKAHSRTPLEQRLMPCQRSVPGPAAVQHLVDLCQPLDQIVNPMLTIQALQSMRKARPSSLARITKIHLQVHSPLELTQLPHHRPIRTREDLNSMPAKLQHLTLELLPHLQLAIRQPFSLEIDQIEYPEIDQIEYQEIDQIEYKEIDQIEYHEIDQIEYQEIDQLEYQRLIKFNTMRLIRLNTMRLIRLNTKRLIKLNTKRLP